MQVADLDVLSRGRVEFGVGIGWLREEYEALGVPWARRGARVDEYLQVFKSCWTDEVTSFAGDIVQVTRCRMYPKPVQRPHPPLHIGGGGDAAFRRAARHGSGWYGMAVGPDELPALRKRLDVELAECGRDRSDFQVSIAPPFGSFGPGLADQYRDLGADRLIVPLAAFGADDLHRALDALTAAGV